MDNSGLLAMGAGMLIFSLAIMVFLIITMWKIFTKAGQPGWAIFIPIYNLYVYTQVIRRPNWWILVYIGIMGLYYAGFAMIMSGSGAGAALTAVGGIALLVISIMDTHRLSTSFGQGAGFTVGLVLLGIIFYPILAFGNYHYVGGAAVSIGGPIDQNL